MHPSVGTFDEDARAKREDETSKARLLTLPAELRNRIYHQALHIEPSPTRSIFYDPQEIAILQTSRQLRKETLPIFFGQTLTVSAWNSGDTIRKLQILDADPVSCLRHLTICDGSLCECRNCCGADGKDKNFHWYEVEVERQVDGLRHELRCYRNPRPGNKGDLTENCPEADRWHSRMSPVLNRMKQHNQGFAREDLLALIETMRNTMNEQFKEWMDQEEPL